MDGVGYDDRDYSDAELATAEQTQENISESGEITSDQIETEIVVTEYGIYWAHHVTLRDLNPETNYTFWVGDGFVFEKVRTTDTNLFTLTTLEEAENIETPIPAYGIIRYYSDEYELFIKSSDAIVYVTLYEEISGVESEVISSVTNISGSWYLDLSSVQTTKGGNFLDSLSEYDVTIVKLKLTMEQGWMGRWTKDIDYVNSAPAETIDTYDPNSTKYTNNEEGLEYEGLSFNDQSEEINLVLRVFADVGFTDIEVTSRTTDNVSTEYARQTSYYANEAKKYYSSVVSGETESKTTTKEEAAVGLAQSTADKDNADTALKTSTKMTKTSTKKVKDNLVTIVEEYDLDESVLDEIEVTQEDLDDYLEDAKGDCGNFDVCEPENGGDALQCGYYNTSSCNCKCSNGEVSVEWGGSCSCSSSGEPIIDHRDDSVTQTAESYLPKTEENRCSNDIVNGDMTCLSSNGCWYSNGYYSRRTYADTGYTCTSGEDENSWRWSGNEIDYDIESGIYIDSVSSEAELVTISSAGEEIVDPLKKEITPTLKNSCKGGSTFYSKDSDGNTLKCNWLGKMG